MPKAELTNSGPCLGCPRGYMLMEQYYGGLAQLDDDLISGEPVPPTVLDAAEKLGSLATLSPFCPLRYVKTLAEVTAQPGDALPGRDCLYKACGLELTDKPGVTANLLRELKLEN